MFTKPVRRTDTVTMTGGPNQESEIHYVRFPAFGVGDDPEKERKEKRR